MRNISRRVLILLLCAALLLPVLAGCAGPDAGETTEKSETTGTDATNPSTTKPGGTTNPGGTTKPGGTSKPTEPSIPDRFDPNTKPYEPPLEDDILDVGYEALPYSGEELYQQLFDPSSKIELYLDMPDKELAKLQKDFENYRSFNSKSPIYRKADLIITITTSRDTNSYRINEVGVRMKGNTSRTDFYNDHDGIYKYIHLKLDFQETFDDVDYYGADSNVWPSEDYRKARKDRTFATLEQLEMRWNKGYDSTYLRETYAYELYRSEGVLAPLTSISSLTWSGVHMGIYTINEPVDEVFLAKRLPEEDLGGDLYKCGWTHTGATFASVDSIGIEDEDKGKFYIYDLKSNKKTSTHASLKNLITKLNSGDISKELFAELVDVDRFLSYAAVSYFLGNPDDLRNNYNNCYIYFLKSSGKVVVIPYDYDRCLGLTRDYDPSGHGMTKDDPFTDLRDGAQHRPSEQENPLFIWSVDKGGFYVAEYAQVLQRVAGNKLLENATFESWFYRAKSLYEDDVKPGKVLYNAEGRKFEFSLADGVGGNMSFQTYMAEKMSWYPKYMAKLDQYLDYVRPIPSNYYIRGDFNGWSNNDAYGMKNEDGLMTITLNFTHDFSFKVYDNLNQDWLGEECIAEDNEVAFTTDDYGNIRLKRGTYLVTYDPETMIITLTKK